MFKIFSVPQDGATTDHEISNCRFSRFLRTYYRDFLSNVYNYGSSSLVAICVIGHASIGVPRSRFLYFFTCVFLILVNWVVSTSKIMTHL